MESMFQRIDLKLDLYASNMQFKGSEFVYQSKLVLDGVR